MRSFAVPAILFIAALAATAANAATPTFNRDIAPILYQNCATCHRPGEVAPFSLLTYADAARKAGLLAIVSGCGAQAGRRFAGWRLRLLRRSEVSARGSARRLGAGRFPAARFAQPVAAHPEGHRHRGADPLSPVRQARRGSVLARIEALRTAHQ